MSRADALRLHSLQRCDEVKITQALGELVCKRPLGHYGEHCDYISGERWT